MNKYITINPVIELKNVHTIINKNSKNAIGYITIYPSTNEICFSTPNNVTIWNTDCLEYILAFIDKNYNSFKIDKKLVFTDIKAKRKTKIFNVGEVKNDKGVIKYYPAWRQYCLLARSESIIYRNELKQILDKLIDLNNKRKAELKQRRKNK